MKIVYKKSFQNRLRDHIEFIASDNLQAAKKLKNQLLRKIQSIPDNPYLYFISLHLQHHRTMIRVDCLIGVPQSFDGRG